jgi:hypothetical protein
MRLHVNISKKKRDEAVAAEYLTTVDTDRLQVLLTNIERQFVHCPPNIDDLRTSQRLIKSELADRAWRGSE